MNDKSEESPAAEYGDLAEIAKALAHPVRLYILNFLKNQSCCYTGKLAEELPYSQPTISQHLKILKDAGLIKGELEIPKIKYCLNLENWSKADRLLKIFFTNGKGIMIKKILVLCTGNSCRSQIAEGYLRHFACDRAEVYSAGVETHGLNPRAVLTMKEDGIDISQHTSNHINEYINIEFDYVITVCDNAKERCPYFPSKAKLLHHNFPDPAKKIGTEEEISQEFKKVRNMIKEYCEKFVSENLSYVC